MTLNPQKLYSPSYQGPLDLVSYRAAGAYSTRRLSRHYRGPCVRVRRKGDNEERDFYFDSHTNELRRGQVVDFLGRNVNGFVTTWYDQSGRGNDVTQSTADDQPRIDSGEMGDNRLSIENKSSFLENTSLNGTGLTFSTAIIANHQRRERPNDTDEAILGPGTDNSGFYIGDITAFFDNEIMSVFDGDGNWSAWNEAGASIAAGDHIYTTKWDSGNSRYALFIDRSADKTNDTVSNPVERSLDAIVIGTRGTNEFTYNWIGSFGEYLIFTDVLTDAEKDQIEANIDDWWKIT